MRIAFIASAKPAAQEALAQLTHHYGQCEVPEADYIVTIGGDGTTLKALHDAVSMPGKPVLGMRLEGSVGFLANRYEVLGLPQRLAAARRVNLRPLKAEVEQAGANTITIFSFNEIVLMRQRLQTAKLMLTIEGTDQARQLVGDGLLIATPVGSTGYNRSQGGPCLPLGSSLLAVTGLAVHHTSNCDWPNVVLSDRERINVETLNPTYRPVRLETFLEEVPDVIRVRISLSNRCATLLLEERGRLW